MLGRVALVRRRPSLSPSPRAPAHAGSSRVRPSYPGLGRRGPRWGIHPGAGHRPGRGEPTQDRPGGCGRRCRRRPGGDLVADRPPCADDRGVRHDRVIPRREDPPGHRRPARLRPHREGRPHRPARRPDHVLSGPVQGPDRSEGHERAGRRPVPVDAEGRCTRHLRLGRGYGRAGVRDQPGVRRHADLRGDPKGQSRRVHPLGRQHLRRQPDPFRDRAGRRQGLEEHRHRGHRQGRRDPGRVPGPLPLQSHGREPPTLPGRGPPARAVGRPRGAQQLVPRRDLARRRPVQGPKRRSPRRAGEAGVLRVHPHDPASRRPRADLPQGLARAPARRLPARPALLQGAELAEPPASLQPRGPFPRA